MGNLSHIHALIWLKDGELEDATLDRIRGSTDDLIGPDEVDNLIQEGIIHDEHEVIQIVEEALHILRHTCSAQCKK